MAFQPQIKVPATYMRGGTSKGIFFKLDDLPAAAQTPGAARDKILLRVIGSPDPYGKQIDGMGGATSSTSKTVILSKSSRPDHDIDYLFGQVSIDSPFVDWSGNCGNLSAAVGPFAISNGLVDAARVPKDGIATIRIWQANIGKTIIAHVPITNGAVQETGDFELDGVTFPAAEVKLEFLDPADDDSEGEGGAMFPSGQRLQTLNVPGVGDIEAMLESRNLGGKCGDLNALFVGLSRSVGIPARDIYGLRVAPSIHGYKSLGVGAANITRAQHCRAEFYSASHGWVPVDPADVRKVILEEPPGNLPIGDAKVKLAREKLFGAWEMNWLAYNYDHDVALPGSKLGKNEKIGYLMYPQAEINGNRVDSLDPDNFKYKITSKLIA